MNKRSVFILAVAIVAALLTPSLAQASPGHVEPVPTVEDFVAPNLEKAKALAKVVPDFVTEVLIETPYERRQAVLKKGLSVKDVSATYFLLDSPLLKKNDKDLYGPVHFMHGKHIALLDQDCSTCHHLRPKDPKALETTSCGSCHQQAFDQKNPERLGLKAAYHNQCIGCHTERHAGPTGCTECHANNVPDHKELVKLTGKPSPSEVTQECLRCHDKQGEDMLKSAHWLWRGPSPYTVERTKEVMIGKGTTALNNF